MRYAKSSSPLEVPLTAWFHSEDAIYELGTESVSIYQQVGSRVILKPQQKGKYIDKLEWQSKPLSDRSSERIPGRTTTWPTKTGQLEILLNTSTYGGDVFWYTYAARTSSDYFHSGYATLWPGGTNNCLLLLVLTHLSHCQPHRACYNFKFSLFGTRRVWR